MQYTPVTLYHMGYSEETRLDTWERVVYPNAHWHCKLAANYMASQSGSGLHSASVYTVRIFTQEALAVCTGEFLVRGLCDAETPAQIPPDAQRMTVLAVTDARRGTAGMRHWKLEGQ